MSKKFFYSDKDDSILKGPFYSLNAIKKAILENSKETFDSACSCLKKDPDTNWFGEIYIFEQVAIVKPIVKASIMLEEVAE